MATTRNVPRSRSLATKLKPKAVSSSEPEAKIDGSDRKTNEKPLPNYLKPTISSRPNPVKKNNAVEDNQKLLRRRSLDRPSSCLTAKSTSSSSHTIPARPRDKPVVPRESKRGGLRGSSTVKSHPVVSRGTPSAKTSGLNSSSSSKSKKEGSENGPKKSSDEITLESSPHVAPAHEDEEVIVKVETDVKVSDHREEPKEEVEVARPDESSEEIETEDPSIEEVKEELINEDKTEETKQPENTHHNNIEDIDDEQNSKAEEEAKAKDEKGESRKVQEGTEETKTQLENLQEKETKKEVVQGKKVCQTVYNDVIASKMQENPKKNKVLALAGAFQTVIDYETAASK